MKPPSSTRLSALPASLRRPPPNRFQLSRPIHIPPPVSDLPFSIDHGLPPFLSSSSLKLLAIDWHEGLLDRLNQHVKGTEVEHKSLFDTIVHLAKDRTQVIPFNLASEALNNSFFLNGLKKPQSTTTSHEASVKNTININNPSKTSSLYSSIQSTYGSITQFKSYFSNAAMGMSTSGYIWLTSDQDGSLGICATYGGGTLLVQNRQQRGDWPRAIAAANIGLDAAGRPRGPPGGEGAVVAQEGAAHSGAGQPERSGGVRMFSTSGRSTGEADSGAPRVSFADSLFASPSSPSPRGPSSSPTALTNRAITRKNTNPSERFSQVHPLMCLAVAERAYLKDYGVWGKAMYVGNFWRCVDWDKVERAFEKRVPATAGMVGSRSWNAGGSAQAVWNS